MATVADTRATPLPAAGPLTAFVDRWIYVFMAGLIMAVVLTAFIPDAIGMVAGIKAGEVAPLTPILHVHAVLMGSWITLLLVQAWLMASGRRGWHMQLGLVAFGIAPAIVIAGMLLVPSRIGQYVAMAAAASPQDAAELRAALVPNSINILLGQIRIGLAFPLLVGFALYLRTRDPETHKRLMVLATLSPLPAAIDRMWYLPSTLPGSPLSWELCVLLLASPMLAWDLYHRRRLPRAYLIWFAVMIPTGIAMILLWNTPWWIVTGSRLLGVG